MTTSASMTVEAPTLVDSLQGTWYNQLGSELTIEADPTGSIWGTYRPGTGAAAGQTYPLAGSYDQHPTGKATVLGFVVDWTEGHSVTVWSGQYHHEDGAIKATWLLSTETDVADEWKSTFIGHDVFHRDRDTAAAPF